MPPLRIDLEGAEQALDRAGKRLERSDQRERETVGPARRCAGGQWMAHDQGCSCAVVWIPDFRGARIGIAGPLVPSTASLRCQRRIPCWRPGSDHTDRPGSGTASNSWDRTRASAPGARSMELSPRIAGPSQSGIAGPYDPRRRAGKSGRHVVRLRDGAGMLTQGDRPHTAHCRTMRRPVHGARAGHEFPWEWGSR